MNFSWPIQPALLRGDFIRKPCWRWCWIRSRWVPQFLPGSFATSVMKYSRL